MEFIYPSFLWALGVLVLPIIIHLFYFRRFKKVEFTNVRFLKEIKEETASRSKLKNLLVLLSRLLAIAFLVFAFCQPFLSDGEDIKKGEKLLSMGDKIDAHQITLLASQGISHIKVHKKPKIAVFASGNELKMHFEKVDQHKHG